jgi:glutathione S-transferase
VHGAFADLNTALASSAYVDGQALSVVDIAWYVYVHRLKLLVSQPVPDALFEATFQQPGVSADAFVVAARMSFRGARPATVEDWVGKLTWIDKEVLNDGDH